MKRLILCFDGTWNTPNDEKKEYNNASTNVFRLYNSVIEGEARGITQLKWYDEGVGTRWYDRLRGGIAGVGLSKNTCDGYHYLAKNYTPGDHIFLFGFSRGAYTARSLAGLIRNCGILKYPDTDSKLNALIQEAYQIYRTRDEGTDSEQAKAFRKEHSHATSVEIQCLGVWDTVGALGIPLPSFEFFNRRFYEFHDVNLSSIVKNAFHALAIDEHRQQYGATVWNPSETPDQNLEQIWFPGAHANVGGGYENDKLADVSLAWMMERAAEKCGLAFNNIPALPEAHWTIDLRDSFAEFLRGVYQYAGERYYRPIGNAQYGCEWLDRSAIERFKLNKIKSYKPENPLGVYLGCEGATPEMLQQLVGGKIVHLLRKLDLMVHGE